MLVVDPWQPPVSDGSLAWTETRLRSAASPRRSRTARSSRPRTRSSGSQAEFVIGPAFLHRSVLNFGRIFPAAGCLRVVVFGGSSTCGQFLPKDILEQDPTWDGVRSTTYTGNHTDSPNGTADAWPAVAEEMLNEALPCSYDGKQQHVVYNMCEPGAGTEYWIDAVAEASAEPDGDLARALGIATVVILETEMNDVVTPNVEWGANPQAELLVQVETVVRMIMARIGSPSVGFLKLKSLGHWDAETMHIAVSKHYQLPHVSVPDAFGRVEPGGPLEAWLRDSFQTDGLHPSKLGHRIIGRLVAQFLVRLVHSQRRPPLPFLAQEPTVAPMLYASNATVAAYLASVPLRIVTTEAFAGNVNRYVRPPHSMSAGWAFVTESKGRRGLVSFAVGDAVSFSLTSAETKKHLRSGLVHVHLLRSYEHMGTAVVEASVPSAPGCDLAQKITIDSAHVDCLWQERVSEQRVTELSVPPSAVCPPDAAECSCLLVTVRVAESAPARVENKIKLTEIVIF